MNTCINPDKILKYIKDNKLTKEEFCNKCKIDLSTLKEILKGEKVEFSIFYRLAQTMKIDICFMYNEKCTRVLFIY